ncbi:MAG: hypothetical protein WDZ86_01305, partial [Gammaproteobacteria bacterium]
MSTKITMPRKWGGSLLSMTALMLAGSPVYAQGTTDSTISTLPSIDVREILPSEVRYAPGAA